MDEQLQEIKEQLSVVRKFKPGHMNAAMEQKMGEFLRLSTTFMNVNNMQVIEMHKVNRLQNAIQDSRGGSKDDMDVLVAKINGFHAEFIREIRAERKRRPVGGAHAVAPVIADPDGDGEAVAP